MVCLCNLTLLLTVVSQLLLAMVCVLRSVEGVEQLVLVKVTKILEINTF